VPADLLSDVRRVVFNQVGDLLDRHIVVTENRNEGVAKLAGVQSSPTPDAFVMDRNARRTLPAVRAVPFLMQKTRPWSSVLRDFSVLVPPPARTERHT
jgi:hypothetical protein